MCQCKKGGIIIKRHTQNWIDNGGRRENSTEREFHGTLSTSPVTVTKEGEYSQKEEKQPNQQEKKSPTNLTPLKLTGGQFCLKAHEPLVQKSKLLINN